MLSYPSRCLRSCFSDFSHIIETKVEFTWLLSHLTGQAWSCARPGLKAPLDWTPWVGLRERLGQLCGLCAFGSAQASPSEMGFPYCQAQWLVGGPLQMCNENCLGSIQWCWYKFLNSPHKGVATTLMCVCVCTCALIFMCSQDKNISVLWAGYRSLWD